MADGKKVSFLDDEAWHTVASKTKKKKKKGAAKRGIPLVDWGTRTKSAEELRDERCAARRAKEAERRAEEQAAADKVATSRQAILDAPDVEKMMEAIDNVAPEAAGIDPKKWLETLVVCRDYPELVYRFRDSLFGADRYTFEVACIGTFVWSAIHHGVVSLDYPAGFSKEPYPGARGPMLPVDTNDVYDFRLMMVDDVHKKLDDWARTVSARHQAREAIEKKLGLVIPEPVVDSFDGIRPKLRGIDVRIDKYEDIVRRKPRTISFSVRIMAGPVGERMLEDLLKMVVLHNTTHARPYPPTEWLVCDSGCVRWAPGDDFPEDTLVMSEHYMSYYMGKGGCNIKQFAETNGIYGVYPTCIPTSPQLPVVFLSKHRLGKGKISALKEYIADVKEDMHPTYDPYGF